MRDRVHPVILCGALAACLIASPAFAQMGRVGGTVRDESGQPIKGATVTAENPQASPSTWTATTDDRGRFSIIGLRNGIWTFTAQAPGYAPSQGQARIQTLGNNPPIEFKLARGAAGPSAGAVQDWRPRAREKHSSKNAYAPATLCARPRGRCRAPAGRLRLSRLRYRRQR